MDSFLTSLFAFLVAIGVLVTVHEFGHFWVAWSSWRIAGLRAASRVRSVGTRSTHDRDVNAAINLKNMAVSSTASACGEEGAGSGHKTGVKPASMKQEASFESV